ncbi:IDLC protein, partial [Amia calva]|nr:IDLC protein [Amia calva]
MPPPPQPPKTAADDANEEQTKQLLHAILPPRLWIEDNKLWVQQVSTIPSTRMDVVHLQEQLDRKLEMKQGRKTGICPIRRDLYSQCFDELIRQNTISCAERGLLLLRVRNEIMMTIAAYQTLYESSIAYGMRKALQAELSKSNMKTKMSDLENEKKDLERQLRELKSVHAAYEEDEAARWQVEETKHSDALKSVTRSNQQLRVKKICNCIQWTTQKKRTTGSWVQRGRLYFDTHSEIFNCLL